MRQPQPKWTQTKVDYKGQTTDENYQGVVGYHNPLWRYIINHHPTDDLPPICVVGNTAIPLAIEFSQFGFPTTFVTDNEDGVKKAKNDCEIHSGKFKNFYYADYIKTSPSSKIIIFVNVLDQLKGDEVFDFLDMLLRRCREVVCAVRNDRNWREVLSGNYNINMSQYSDGSFVLLSIKENV